MEKSEATAFTWKVATVFASIVGPALFGQVVLWAHGEASGKKLSMRVRIALFFGSIGIGAAVHVGCERFGLQNFEWLIIWVSSVFVNHLLNFMYVQCWDIVREWLKNSLKQGLNRLNKK